MGRFCGREKPRDRISYGGLLSWEVHAVPGLERGHDGLAKQNSFLPQGRGSPQVSDASRGEPNLSAKSERLTAMLPGRVICREDEKTREINVRASV
jgi:hypothetical protein